LIEKLQAVLLKNMEREGISFKAKYEQGVITATDGGRLQPPGNTPLPGATTLVSEAIGAVYSDQRASNGHFGALTIKEVGGELQLRWSGNGTTHASILNADHQPVDKGGFKFDFSYGCEYDFTSDAQGVISFRSKNTRYDATMVVVDWADLPRAAAALTIAEYKETLANERMPALTKGFTNFNMEIDLFILHNLLFRGAQVFQTDLVDTKDQLVILGQLSPELTTFQIDPVEPIVGAGRTHAFKITGADVPVTWSVANLPDGEGDPGEIDKITGVYTAPLRADLPDNQKRVIVTATANSGGAVSRALVGIVSRDIGLDPIVMMASAGAKGYKVRATPLDPDEKLTISMSAGALGKVIDDPDADPDVPYSKLYVPPASRAGPVSGPEPIPAHWLEYRKSPGWTVDEELAEYLHVEQVIAKGSNASTQEVEVLLLRKNITNWFEFKQSGKGIQLEHWSTNKKLGDHIVPEEMTIWIKVKGAGTLVGGLYTPDDSADETYAVIVAIEMNDDDWKWVPTILPIPFMGVETYLNMWSEDLK